MKKRWTALIVILIIAFGMLIPAQAEEEASDVRHSVAVVSVYYSLLEQSSEIEVDKGSGFFIGHLEENPEYLITNHHVIKKYLQAGSGEIVEGFLDEEMNFSEEETENSIFVKKLRATIKVYFNSTEYMEAYMVAYDELKDFAILKLEAPTDQRRALKICEPDDNMVGKAVRVVGYPGVSDNQEYESTSKWSEKDASITAGTISRLLTITGKGVRAIQTDALIQHGHSGGPLINENNAVVGVNSWGLTSVTTQGTVTTEIEEVNYALDIREIIPVLEQHGIEYDRDDPYDPDHPDDPDPVPDNNIIFIAVAVIAVIAVGMTLILIKRKSTSAQNKEDKKESDSKQQQFSKTPVVISLSPQHSGMRLSLKNRQVVIGRDASICTLVYEEGTAGVSGKHCSLIWDEISGEFILTDLNSTYGTFLYTGKRMDAGIPYHLKAGESFYLGDSKNMLRVEME